MNKAVVPALTTSRWVIVLTRGGWHGCANTAPKRVECAKVRYGIIQENNLS